MAARRDRYLSDAEVDVILGSPAPQLAQVTAGVVPAALALLRAQGLSLESMIAKEVRQGALDWDKFAAWLVIYAHALECRLGLVGQDEQPTAGVR